ncbi:hypothetical protein KQ940_20935 [Marinobacterium sp. D7]|uniref:hypothetical protein n=1 Tax=Marinobacterium ramblicola TaxID=2849041 RepID=UPI001C2CF910|nr:hypothetical protein [Marinobacterium ramblicola]MBV1790533.1 hypothetical protein [Marinobacterium ramblicola]
MSLLLEEIFVTEGMPRFTFVKPPNYNNILLDVRHPGKPVIIEGQSGTGKTTCIRKILEQLGDATAEYLTARSPTDLHAIEEVARGRRKGRFVVDDFHRLSDETQTALGDIAKHSAESDEPEKVKLIIIGINRVGSELIQLVPDIAKRVGTHRIQAGSQQNIESLISEGCVRLNITINNWLQIYEESQGDYWLTQQLCQMVCMMNDVMESQSDHLSLSFELNDLRARVVEKLSSAYDPAVKEFCRGVRFRPNNDPYYKLLKKISEQDGSIVDLNELANANEDVRGSINNIKEYRLAVLLRDKPLSGRHFYYNPESKNFAIEDPALFFYLKHLNWDALRKSCGFREESRDYEYDIAISFAGENRCLAREISNQLGVFDSNVFFDENFESNFLGGAWSSQFEKIFGRDSRLVVCLLDSFYRDKIWPTFERECFIPRVQDKEVIPIFLDDTKFVGIPSDIIGIMYRYDREAELNANEVTDEIVYKLVDRLGVA